MPSTVHEIFAAAELTPEGVVRWRTRAPESERGVYVVALTDDVYSADRARTDCPLSGAALEELLDTQPELTVDGERPDRHSLGKRLGAFWLPDEVILYVGLAGTSLRARIDQYYCTPLGARTPHAGGWFLKTLTVLPELYVHYARCAEPPRCEETMLRAFSTRVAADTAAALHDSDRPIPFANLEWPKGRYKKHGIKGAKAARAKRRGRTRTHTARNMQLKSSRDPSSAHSGDETTQRITETDIRCGRIRIPRGSTKRLFPTQRGHVELELRGERFTARWDPRYGPDRERSGVLGIGHEQLGRLVRADEVLRVSLSDGVLRVG